jgi:hypothetical protein
MTDNETTSATKAQDLAETVTDLVNAANTRAREDVARRLLAMVQEAKAPPAPDQTPGVLMAQMGAALITAQSMEDAIRTIIQPMLEASEGFAILSAVEACLDKIAREVDAAIEDYQGWERAALEVPSHG